MARPHPAISTDSDSDEMQPQPRTTNKENRVPGSNFSLTAPTKAKAKTGSRQSSGDELDEDEDDDDELSSKSIKAATKRRAPAPAPKRASAVNNKPAAGKRGKKAAVEEPADEQADESDEVVQETQEDDDMELGDVEPAPKKAAAGSKAAAGVGARTKAAAKKGRPHAGDADAAEGATVKERRLQAKLEATTAALDKITAAFEQLRNLRETGAESSEKALSDIANARYEQSRKELMSYKSEIEALRTDNAELRRNTRAISHAVATPPKPSRTSTTSSSVELESALAMSETERTKLVATLEEREGAERKKLESRDAKWQKELAKTIKAKDEEAAKTMAELKTDLATATQELEAEIQHSKSLQAKLKAGPGAVLSTAPSATSASSSALQKLQEEFASLKARSELAEDLSGLSVRSQKVNDDGSSSFSCLLTDCRGKTGTLIFKLQFLLDGSVCYEPDIDPERDPVLFNLLADAYKGFMRFDAEDATIWYLNLFRALNKPAKSHPFTLSRQSQALRLGAVLVAVYLSLVLNLLPTPFVSQSIRDQIVPCLPFNLVVALGSYCLWELGMGVLTFGECDDAYEELRREIKEATDDLRARGVSVD